MRAFLVNKPGKNTALELKKMDDPVPAANEVVIRHTAIGINYFDVLFRNGSFKLSESSAILGTEGVGIIEKIGSAVVDYKVGEKVAYCTGPIGAYAEKRAIAQDFLVTPPPSLTDEQIVGALLKGVAAHTLLYRTFRAQLSKRILVHAAAGGIGHLLSGWARHLGIEVIGTVGSDAKIPFAKSFGCNHVINYAKQDFVTELGRITNDEGVGVVYDGVGKDTIIKSLDCLWPMGMCVSYGEASGPTPPIDLNRLFLNAAFITRPFFALYKSTRVELVLTANEVFKSLEQGILKPHITTYGFEQIPQAHFDLESRKSIGSLVIKL